MGTLKKFKHILKKGALTTYKKDHPKVNEVFSQMSQFFHLKQKKIEIHKITAKQGRA